MKHKQTGYFEFTSEKSSYISSSFNILSHFIFLDYIILEKVKARGMKLVNKLFLIK